MTLSRVSGRVERATHPAVRHLRRAVGETCEMHRVSDRFVQRVRAQGERAA
jgi:hypothetical protein